MPLDIDVSKLHPLAQRVLSPVAPAPARNMAAGGVVPGLPAQDLVTVVACLTESETPELALKASKTLLTLPVPVLNGALAADLEPAVVRLLADAYSGNASVVERLLRMPRIDAAALEILATRADERIGEIVATNEERLLANPTVIEKLYLNKQVRMSTADRILELAVRNGVTLAIPAFKEAAQAIQSELIAEATPEPTFEDVVAKECEEIGQKLALDTAVEDTHVVDEEGKEQIQEKVLPLHARLGQMTISQKIRRAMLGTGAERMLLVRDTNRLVAVAAVTSPMMNEHDIARVSTSRQVSEDVLRHIALNKEWTRVYQIKLNLVSNPRTPMSFTSRLIPQLHDHDVKSLAKSKNVPASVQTLARQQLARKEQKKK
jgi:hypothetical protein